MARRIRRPYNAIERKDSDHRGIDLERWWVRWLIRSSMTGSLFTLSTLYGRLAPNLSLPAPVGLLTQFQGLGGSVGNRLV